MWCGGADQKGLLSVCCLRSPVNTPCTKRLSRASSLVQSLGLLLSSYLLSHLASRPRRSSNSRRLVMGCSRSLPAFGSLSQALDADMRCHRDSLIQLRCGLDRALTPSICVISVRTVRHASFGSG